MTELTDLSETDSANTAIGAYTLDGNVANMSEMDDVIQAILGMLARGPVGIVAPIDRLTLSNNSTDATNDIDIAAGNTVDSTGVRGMTLASALTKRLDAAWAVGTGNGGLDTGSIANTTYHVYLIKRPDTGVVDAIFSTSASAPTLPTNYTLYRRIGSIVRVSGAIKLFTQIGRTVIWGTSALDLTSTNPGGGAPVNVNLTVPSGVFLSVNVNVVGIDSAGDSRFLVSSPLAGAEIFIPASNNSAYARGALYPATFTGSIITNASGQIRLEAAASATNTVNVRTYGFTYLD